ncbi:MAG: sigma-70 family RNA polymerase sigma factor [Ruminococcus sp.]|nr:sigma-70 family RNA polymerase sigma factor [Ruminococcus sp.]
MEKMNITAKTSLSEVITLLDLKPGQKKKGKTPTRLKLTTSEEPLVQIHGSTLYASGYALYENGLGRHSVVWLPYCVNFTYYFNKLRDAEKDYLRERSEVSDKALMETSWATITALFGEERITQSMNRGFGNADPSADGDSIDEENEDEPEAEDMEGRNFVWYDETLGVDPLDAVIRRENREEMLAAMTDKQREVFVLYHKYGWTQQQIADKLGISKMSVCERLKQAKSKMRTFVSKKFF